MVGLNALQEAVWLRGTMERGRAGEGRAAPRPLPASAFGCPLSHGPPALSARQLFHEFKVEARGGITETRERWWRRRPQLAGRRGQVGAAPWGGGHSVMCQARVGSLGFAGSCGSASLKVSGVPGQRGCPHRASEPGVGLSKVPEEGGVTNPELKTSWSPAHCPLVTAPPAGQPPPQRPGRRL